MIQNNSVLHCGVCRTMLISFILHNDVVRRYEMSSVSVDMGRRIRSKRKKMGIMQYKLADKLDISNNHMSAIENGKENISLDLLLRICRELDVTPDYLLLGSMDTQNAPKDIMDKLKLCKPETVKLVSKFIDMMMDME